MPTYQYICDDCGHEFERVQRFHEDPIRVCPACAQETARRVISAAGIVFKGSGWYVTDSKSSNPAGTTAKKSADKAEKPQESTSAEPAKTDTSAGSSAPAESKASGKVSATPAASGGTE